MFSSYFSYLLFFLKHNSHLWHSFAIFTDFSCSPYSTYSSVFLRNSFLSIQLFCLFCFLSPHFLHTSLTLFSFLEKVLTSPNICCCCTFFIIYIIYFFYSFTNNSSRTHRFCNLSFFHSLHASLTGFSF